ncbi:MAG TPA: DUF5801 repeats-in-toxin domain-containing protein, partial [Nitrobacter sp.]|nr:DUF5801 repeats-in-toxin domain-containing protein [Nitrobacter sp.]
MNGPFRIAQADGTHTGGNNKQERIVKITKPYGDQSVVVALSYDGTVKADLSAIASEKITLVHLGEKLIILFDNHSTVTLEPFFDSTGHPLQDLTVELSPGHDVTSAEFATLFPVTDDQSVLPAAGTGSGGGAQASGANFTTVGVDPLSVGNPLALLGQEELPNFVIANLLAENNQGVGASAGFSLLGTSVVEDETAGVQSADGANDQPGLPPFTPPAGTDPLIGWAQSHDSIVGASSAAFGTVGGGTVTYALTDSGGHPFSGVDTGLKATVSGNEIFLYTVGNLVVGREGSGITANADGKVVFALYLEPESHKLDVAQYEAISHPDTTNPNDSVNLGSLVHVTQTVTDAQAEVATATSGAISITFLDDGPTLTATHTELPALVVDESFLAADANNPDAGSHQDPTGATAAIGTFTALFQADFGTDGPQGGDAKTAISYALGLTGTATTVDGVTGIDSGVKDTLTGHEVMLNLVGNEIVGTVLDGDALRTVFTITGSADGTITLQQDRAVVHGDPNDPDQAGDPTVLHLGSGASVTLTATATDGDGDHVSQSVDVSGAFAFKDDGPTLSVSAPGVINGFDFGAFALNGNAWGHDSGVATGTNGGWTISDANDGHSGSDLISDTGNGTVQLERVGDGYEGMHASNNGDMVDLDASPHDIKISQTVTGLVTGQTYDLRFEAGAPFPNSAHLEVWFGGVKVYDLAPNGQMTAYDIQITGGSGDGSNLLEFRETGTPDNQGTYLANVSVGEIVIDETAGNQPNTNDVDANHLFDAVVNQGSDGHMLSPQFAQGISAAVNVAANFGADGPWHGSATEAMTYALSTVNGTDSGLTTTAGQHILLFNETYNGVQYVVGRYDSSGDQSVTSSDAAAFAFRVDPATGVLSLVQYVSLHQPDTNSNNEGVFLNTGSLSVSVTVTDGDGDHVSQSADISANIRFDDDGPTLTATHTELPTLVVDESFLAADANNPDAGSHQAPSGSATDSLSFTGLFSADFGADGPQGGDAKTAISYALGLTGTATTVDGVTGIDSGVRDTLTGHEVMLNLVGNEIVGTVLDGNAVRTVFTITGSADGTITLQQDRAVVHGDPNDPDQAGDPTVLHLGSGASVTLTATATDGDGDHVSQSVDVSGAFAFKDDGPTLTVAVHDAVGTNLITNGSFEVVTDGGQPGAPVTEQGGWELYSSIPGWTTAGGVPLEIQQDQNGVGSNGVSGVPAQNGVNIVELDSDLVGNDPGQDENSTTHTNVTLQQTVATVVGQTYELSFYEQPRPNFDPATSTFEVKFGNSVVTLHADGSPDANGWQHYTATVTATSASTVLSFIGTGTEDSWGALLDNVSLTATTAPEIVIDETPTTPQAGTNETIDAAIVGLFAGVQHPGVDHDMPAQYATGSAPVLDVNVDFGADGPSQNPNTAATAYSLTLGSAGTNGLVDSGLATTDGREIYLFKEGNLIVGRYDAPHDGNTVVNSSDPAAFAIAIDPATGVVSIAQYVSLNNPITTDSNDPVFLNTGALSATVTVTDGDGDHVSQSADIGALIQFDDDGPTLVANASTTATVNEANIFDLWSHGTDPDFLAHTDGLGAAYTTGSLSNLVNFGADGPGSFSFTATATTQLAALGLTSHGEALSYAIVDGVLIGYVDHGQPGPSLDDRPVFALTLTANGNYDFELFSQLDHDKPASGADTNTTLQDNG